MAEVPTISREENNRPPTLGEGTPTPDNPRLRQRRENISRWRGMGASDKIRSVAQAGVRAVPLIGRNAHSSLFGDDESNIGAARVGAPMSTFGAEAIGGGLPYMAGGPLSLTGRIAAGGVLGAADAHMEGEDPIRGGAVGALASGAGHFVPSAITPRPRLKRIRQQTHEAYQRHRGTAQYRRELSDYMTQNMPPGQYSNRRIYDALERQYANQWREQLFHDLSRLHGMQGRPNINIGNISAPLRALGGFGMSGALGHNPIPWVLGSLLAGPVSRAGQRAIDNIIDNPSVIRYVNNELMGPTGARVLHGAATGAAQQGVDSRIPKELKPYEAILKQLGMQGNAPQR